MTPLDEQPKADFEYPDWTARDVLREVLSLVREEFPKWLAVLVAVAFMLPGAGYVATGLPAKWESATTEPPTWVLRRSSPPAGRALGSKSSGGRTAHERPPSAPRTTCGGLAPSGIFS